MVAFRPVMGLAEQHLLRTLQRLHADLKEHLEDGGDDDEPLIRGPESCGKPAP